MFDDLWNMAGVLAMFIANLMAILLAQFIMSSNIKMIREGLIGKHVRT